jgi:hypothetical protein
VLDEAVTLGRSVVVELAVAEAAVVDTAITEKVGLDATVVDVGSAVVSVVARVVEVVVVAAATRSLTLGSSGFVDVTSNTCGGCDST